MPHAANQILLTLVVLACVGTEWSMPCFAQDQALRVAVNPEGRYSIGRSGSTELALTAGVAAEVDGRWLHSADYPQHAVKKSFVEGFLGAATEWQVLYS